MLSRYTRPEMAAIWSEHKKYECWLGLSHLAGYRLLR